MTKFKGDQHYRHFITHYTPDSFLKPIIIFSLLVDIDRDESELAVSFVGALNVHHALSVLYGDKLEFGEKHFTDFKVIGKYKVKEGLKVFEDLSLNMTWAKYLDFWQEHYDNSLPRLDEVKR